MSNASPHNLPPDTPLSFRWWDEQAKNSPERFLEHDFANQSRLVATQQLLALAKKYRGPIVCEVGPGQGYDFANYLRAAHTEGEIRYCGVEGSQGLLASLKERFPDATWLRGFVAELPKHFADVMYARHVFEHQADIVKSMIAFCNAAKHAAVICWYRPPGLVPMATVWEDIPHQTWFRPTVLKLIRDAGFDFSVQEVGTDEVWTLRRRTT